jgi:hypothetical protein
MNEDIDINKSVLGAFGEYVYKYYARSNEFEIQKEGIHQIDFKVLNKESQKWIEVDVKTTKKKITSFQGKRVRQDIAYDLIAVNDKKVILYPDELSPFREKIIDLGPFEVLYKQWKTHKSEPQKKTKTQSQINRNILKTKIKNSIQIFADKLKARIVVRGEVSATRWGGFPDNLPGPDKFISTYDLTIFVQLLDHGDNDTVSKIYVFFHNILQNIPMANPSPRQAKKGIKQVIDIDAFERKYPDYVFSSIDQFKTYLKTL